MLIWLTSLPKLPTAPPGAPGGNTYYEGQIYNVVVTGSTDRKFLIAAGPPCWVWLPASHQTPYCSAST